MIFIYEKTETELSLELSHLSPLRPKGTIYDGNKTEREGFEPSTEVASCNSLAGSRFQPLSHLSSSLPTLSTIPT